MTEYVRFALSRVGSAALTLLGISVIIFVAIQLLPGSYEEVFFSRLSPEARALIAEKLGLDRHPVEQYVRWLWAALNGDLGISFITRQPVRLEFASRIPVTAELAVLATVVALVIGVPLGIVSGLSSRRRFVRGASNGCRYPKTSSAICEPRRSR
jgi:peptide/nickel transport system permease protein